jgi:hypothetical protein
MAVPFLILRLEHPPMPDRLIKLNLIHQLCLSYSRYNSLL